MRRDLSDEVMLLKYQSAKQQIAEGVGLYAIAKDVGLHPDTVREIKEGVRDIWQVEVQGKTRYAFTKSKREFLERLRDIVEIYEQSGNVEEAAYQFGLSLNAINTQFRRHGIDRSKTKVSPHRNRVVRELYHNEGMDKDKLLAKKYGHIWSDILSKPNFSTRAFVKHGVA